MNKQLAKDSLGWGFILWLIGYILGFVLFFAVPVALIGWVIPPIGVAITLWVLLKKVQSDDLLYYLILAVVWTMIAVVFDYVFIVKALSPEDGYYKLDVYIYYVLCFTLPLIAYGWKSRRKMAAG